MLAMARALCIQPKVLLLDEPTEGLQPSMIELISNVVVQMRAEGLVVILVEQHVDAVLTIADQVAFIQNGKTPEALSVEVARAAPEKIHRYLGV